MGKTKEELIAGANKISHNELPESNTGKLIGEQLLDIINATIESDATLKTYIDNLNKKGIEVSATALAELGKLLGSKIDTINTLVKITQPSDGLKEVYLESAGKKTGRIGVDEGGCPFYDKGTIESRQKIASLTDLINLLSKTFQIGDLNTKKALDSCFTPGSYNLTGCAFTDIDGTEVAALNVEVYAVGDNFTQEITLPNVVYTRTSKNKFYPPSWQQKGSKLFDKRIDGKRNVEWGIVGLDGNKQMDASLIPLDYRRAFGYRFDGASSIDVPSDKILFGENDFSVEVYFRPLVVNALNCIMLKLESHTYWGIFIREDGLVGINTVKDQYVQAPTSKNKLVAGNWYHLMITRQGDKQFIYLNGIYETVTCDLMILNVDNKQNLHIGGQNGYEFFKGDIGLIRFYNYSLSQSDIAYYYNGGRPDLRNLRYADIINTYDELLRNGTFDNNVGWFFNGPNWSISNGLLNSDGSSADSYAVYGGTSQVGKRYRTKITANVTSGSIRIFTGSVLLSTVTSSGSYTFDGNVVSHEVDSLLYMSQPSAFLGSVDNVSVKQIGCILELLPENATKIKWLETQNNQNGVVLGGCEINIDVPMTSMQLTDTIAANIALGVANKDFVLPTGWYVQSIYMHSPKVLTKVQCVSNALYSQIPLLIDKTIGGGGSLFNISADQVIYTSPTILRFNACGNIDNNLSISISIKKAL